MAKVTGPLGSSEARGAVGGYVYNTWRGISTVRSRVKPITQFSPAQIALRTLAKNCTVAWQNISNPKRLAWQDYANIHPDPDWTGNSMRLSGYNWFVRSNVRRQLLGSAIIHTPPTIALTHLVTNLTGFSGASYLEISWTSEVHTFAEDLFVEIYLAGPHSAARNPTIRNAKRIGSTFYSEDIFSLTPSILGWYRLFIRPVHISGVVQGWIYTDVQLTSL